jgi:hypothetical protein
MWISKGRTAVYYFLCSSLIIVSTTMYTLDYDITKGHCFWIQIGWFDGIWRQDGKVICSWFSRVFWTFWTMANFSRHADAEKINSWVYTRKFRKIYTLRFYMGVGSKEKLSPDWYIRAPVFGLFRRKLFFRTRICCTVKRIYAGLGFWTFSVFAPSRKLEVNDWNKLKLFIICHNC